MKENIIRENSERKVGKYSLNVLTNKQDMYLTFRNKTFQKKLSINLETL